MFHLFFYLLGHFFYRLKTFIVHWYIGSFRRFAQILVSVLGRLDRHFALVITLRHFWEPLYGDYTPVGRLLGVIFRSGRAAAAFFVYGAIILVIGAAYILVWWIIPSYAIYRTIF